MATTENWRREKAAATKRLPRGLGFLDLKRAYVNPPRFLLFLIADAVRTMEIDLGLRYSAMQTGFMCLHFCRRDWKHV